jgi:hypothetical protein
MVVRLIQIGFAADPADRNPKIIRLVKESSNKGRVVYVTLEETFVQVSEFKISKRFFVGKVEKEEDVYEIADKINLEYNSVK